MVGHQGQWPVSRYRSTAGRFFPTQWSCGHARRSRKPVTKTSPSPAVVTSGNRMVTASAITRITSRTPNQPGAPGTIKP